MDQTDIKHEYVLGHSGRELERLKAQARLIDPITKRIFQAAGIAPGMRVLDVGSGAGDVAFLSADLVGETGRVVGADRVPVAVETARQRASSRAVDNIEFRVGNPAEMAFEQPFDAVTGRYVLQFQKAPAEMLRQLARKVKPGGLVVFHEIDFGGLSSFPSAPLFDRCCSWARETMGLHGTETQMGTKLHWTFVDAGLAAPTMRLEAMIGGGSNARDIILLVSELIGTLLPEMERLGVASPNEVQHGTLLERMEQEVVKGSNCIIGHFQVGAWSRTWE